MDVPRPPVPGRAKKILLVTDMPPCKGYPTGLLLESLCGFVPREQLACCAVVNPEIPDVKVSPDLPGLRAVSLVKPSERAFRPVPLLGAATAYLSELRSRVFRVPPLCDAIEDVIPSGFLGGPLIEYNFGLAVRALRVRYRKKNGQDVFSTKPALSSYRKLARSAEGCAKTSTGACA